MKSFKDISWNVTEKEYRDDPSLSYSILSKYERTGFHGLSSLFDKDESPSLTFGSVVDTLMTGTEEEFNSRFYVSNKAKVTDKIKEIIDEVITYFNINGIALPLSLDDVDKNIILDSIELYNYQPRLKPETKLSQVISAGSDYYNEVIKSSGKTIISEEDFEDAISCVSALRNSDATRDIFAEDPFNNDLEKLYQLKFKTIINDIPYRCMADLIIVDHKNKTVQPIDLKTSSHYEDEFPKSFLQWNYQIQARLYWRLIRKAMNEDPYFRDFLLLNYKFVVVNRNSLKPLVWDCDFTRSLGDVIIYSKKQERNIKLKDPFDIGSELWQNLRHPIDHPNFIKCGVGDSNSIESYLSDII